MTVNNKDNKMHRAKAKELLDRLVKDIQAYNEDKSNPYFVKTIYVFGSYVNSQKEMLSDLDIALDWEEVREVWDDWHAKHKEEVRKFLRIDGEPYVWESMIYAKRRAIIGFRHRSPYIQFTDYHVDHEAVNSDTHICIDMAAEGQPWILWTKEVE